MTTFVTNRIEKAPLIKMLSSTFTSYKMHFQSQKYIVSPFRLLRNGDITLDLP